MISSIVSEIFLSINVVIFVIDGGMALDAGEFVIIFAGGVVVGTGFFKLVVFQVSPMDKLSMDDSRSDCRGGGVFGTLEMSIIVDLLDADKLSASFLFETGEASFFCILVCREMRR